MGGETSPEATILVAGARPEARSVAVEPLSGPHRTVEVEAGDDLPERILAEEAELLVVTLESPRSEEVLDLLRSVRGATSHPGLPVILLLGSEAGELAARMLREGFDDCVHLPVDAEELRARVDRRLRAARSHDRIMGRLRNGRELFRDLEHRVKGDLQTITSLLNLELRASSGEECRTVLEDVRGRVHTMTLLYKTMRETDGAGEVDLPHYLEAVVAAAAQGAGDRRSGRGWDTGIEDLVIDLDRAGSCGLIVHELVSLAVGGDSAADHGGRVALRTEDEAVVLIVRADRGELGGDAREGGASGLEGPELVRALVRQLGGTLEHEAGTGLDVRVTFPRRPGRAPKARARSGSGASEGAR